MALSGKRSLYALQRRAAKRFVISSGFRDRQKQEEICLVSSEQIAAHLNSLFPNEAVYVDLCQFERGEVLIDNKGSGSIQKSPRALRI